MTSFSTTWILRACGGLFAEAEQTATRDELIMMLQDTISVSDVIKPAVEAAIDDSACDIAFITGVGETFPFVRTHTLLGEIETDKPSCWCSLRISPERRWFDLA